MLTLRNISDRIVAALIFFTRLPFWRLHLPPKDCYRSVVEYWPLTGWLTGSVMAATLYGVSLVAPYALAVIAAIVVRMLLTGALHEDGLSDFFDGFGGGHDRESILRIMKDSRVGNYGVLATVVYLLSLFWTLYLLPATITPWAIVAADPFCKMVSAELIMILPYARTEEEAKAHVVYRPFSVAAGLSLAVQGLLPAIPLASILLGADSTQGALSGWDVYLLAIVPSLVMYALYLLMRSKLKGYTGDCCGATFLLTELTFYLTLLLHSTHS